MRAVLQRALGATLTVPADQVPAPAPAPAPAPRQVVAHFDGEGIVALVGVHRDDTEEAARTMARKIAGLRILTDETSALDRNAPVLLVSQFTLYGQTRKGRRPSWVDAAPGEQARPLIDLVEQELRAQGVQVQTGVFGADMQVSLTNSGPFTVLVET